MTPKQPELLLNSDATQLLRHTLKTPVAPCHFACKLSTPNAKACCCCLHPSATARFCAKRCEVFASNRHAISSIPPTILGPSTRAYEGRPRVLVGPVANKSSYEGRTSQIRGPFGQQRFCTLNPKPTVVVSISFSIIPILSQYKPCCGEGCSPAGHHPPGPVGLKHCPPGRTFSATESPKKGRANAEFQEFWKTLCKQSSLLRFAQTRAPLLAGKCKKNHGDRSS